MNKNPSLEAQIASLSDDIAYIAHDFDDGIRAEILDIKKIANLSDLFDFIDFEYMQIWIKKLQGTILQEAPLIFRERIDSSNRTNLKNKSLKVYQDVINQRIFSFFSPKHKVKLI